MTDDLLSPLLDQLAQRIAAELLPAGLPDIPRAPHTPDFALAVTVAQAAKLIGRSEKQVRQWIRRGIIPVVRLEPEGAPLVRVASLDAVLRQYETGGSGCSTSEEGPGRDEPRKTRGRQLKAVQ